MGKKPGPKGPRIIINWDEFEKLCALHCTEVEIAEWFDCSVDTITDHVKKQYGMNFPEVFKRKSSRGKISMRRKMYEMAIGGDRVMLIWLSKQHLGMSEKVEQQTTMNAEIKQVVVVPANGSEAPNK